VKRWVATCVQEGIPITLACVVALLSSGNAVLAEAQQTEAQILDALKARGPARGHEPAGNPARGSDERQFIEALLKKKSRIITIDDRRRVATIARQKPSIDLEVTFEFNSAVVGPKAVPILVTLGRALGNPALKGATFLTAGHTDAAGDDSYNQSPFERRAEAVKIFLAEQFRLSPDHLLVVGFGRTELKNAADPLTAENRRVQTVNIRQQAAVSQK
jgi:outer membrane protein OmpA-like peptidoglycan-associated protein